MNASKYVISASAALAVVGGDQPRLRADHDAGTPIADQRHHRHAAAHVDLAGRADAADLSRHAGAHGQPTTPATPTVLDTPPASSTTPMPASDMPPATERPAQPDRN